MTDQPLQLPRLIFVGGAKRSGKDFLCDALVAQAGCVKVHIAEQWLKALCFEMGISYVEDYLPNKANYRAEIQRRAAAARQADPLVLVKQFDPWVREQFKTRPGLRLAVSGMRFANEADYAIQIGAFSVRVAVSDDVRRQRFVEAGEDLALFNDPFEAEIPAMPVHCELPGDMPAEWYPPAIAEIYGYLSVLTV